jgi:hypothetical protein
MWLIESEIQISIFVITGSSESAIQSTTINVLDAQLSYYYTKIGIELHISIRLVIFAG